MHEAVLYEKTGDNSVKCGLCSHRCLIKENKSGICGVRTNKGGTLYTESYGRVSAEAVDPVEKKPLYHFLPGTQVYSLGGIGCNFRCKHCQNWEISQCTTADFLHGLSPQKGVLKALDYRCRSIAWTYNEPTLWHEYAMNMGKLAQSEGLGTIYVTNGYMTEEAVSELSGMLSAFRVDIKAFTDDFYRKICGAKLQPVLDATVKAKECGMHVETVTLLIPGLNDSDDEIKSLVSWIYENLGENTPVHFTAFHPDYNMTSLSPTPLKTLEKAYLFAKDAGIRYPYIGNVASHPYCNTWCHNCGALLIERHGFMQDEVNLDKDMCKVCGAKIPVVRSL
ncbi:pyruvate formate lyase activating enzyme [Methanomicrobium sp. W14]|uniref:AmmeMemoRadiSam system radical SAM enzyme n=1 Tax=Methanomicrobium sp. W14 TaxID=2817839 RepID=UPI001AE222E4|nr:AmmeMemoRadiSam system radical SAM enzyme [Methanomicrobium sp. W14]MBP2132178.1 pyruvate formate lyase activating enzyme [Methanomicrobium sp. W14]